MWQPIECDICETTDIDDQISLCVDGIYRCQYCQDMYMFGRRVDYIIDFERILTENFRHIQPINVG